MKNANEIFAFLKEFYYRANRYIYLDNNNTFIFGNGDDFVYYDFVYLGHTEDIYKHINCYESLVASWLQLHDKREVFFTFVFNNKTYQVDKEKLYSKILYNKLTTPFKKYVEDRLEKYKPVYELHCVTNFIDSAFRNIFVQ